MRGRRQPRAAAGAVAALCAAGALAATAGAGAPIPSKVTLKVKGLGEVPDYLHGRVTSDKTACERNREIRVVRRNQGVTETYGTTTSDGDGKWLYEPGGTVPNGHYHAVARPKQVNAGSCSRDRSPAVFVD